VRLCAATSGSPGADNVTDVYFLWLNGSLPFGQWPDDTSAALSYSYDENCTSVVCKRIPQWGSLYPCSAAAITGFSYNFTCYFNQLSPNGASNLTACGVSAHYAGTDNCLCTDTTVVPTNICRCTYARRLPANSTECKNIDLFGECTTLDGEDLGYLNCCEPCGCVILPSPTPAPTPSPSCTNATCNDHDTCTVDTCNSQTGQCNHALIPNCCNCNTDCGAPIDACHINVCVFQETNSSCNATSVGNCTQTPIAGCCFSDSDCTPSDPCFSSVCNLSNNTCTPETPVPCSTTSTGNFASCVSFVCVLCVFVYVENNAAITATALLHRATDANNR
jgi:hypothetical protein